MGPHNPNQQYPQAQYPQAQYPQTQYPQTQYPQQPMGQPMPQPGTGQPMGQPVPITDPNFLNTPLEYDATIDANAALPPIIPSEVLFGRVDVGYTVVATMGTGWTTTRSQDGVVYGQCVLMLEVVDCTKDPSMNGRKVKFDVRTLVYKTSTSSAQQIIQAAGLQQELLTRAKTHQTLIDLVNRIVSEKRRFSVAVDWEASFYDAEVYDMVKGKKGMDLCPRVRGWKSFPVDARNMPIPEITKVVLMPVPGTPGQQVTLTKRAYMVARPLTMPDTGTAASTAPAFNFAQQTQQTQQTPMQPPQMSQPSQPQQPQQQYQPFPPPQQPPQQQQQQQLFPPPQQQQYQPLQQPQQQQPGPNIADIFGKPAGQ